MWAGMGVQAGAWQVHAALALPSAAGAGALSLLGPPPRLQPPPFLPPNKAAQQQPGGRSPEPTTSLNFWPGL